MVLDIIHLVKRGYQVSFVEIAATGKFRILLHKKGQTIRCDISPEEFAGAITNKVLLKIMAEMEKTLGGGDGIVISAKMPTLPQGPANRGPRIVH